QYPYLRLQLDLSDNVQFSPQQLRSWQVHYESVPEMVLLKRDRSDLEAVNTVREGSITTTDVTLWNISSRDFSDSVRVNFNLFNTDRSLIYKDSLFTRPLSAGDSVNVVLEIDTR